uniref:G-protein coupled receptors family 2 profile 1 domain-containing protein n=1 Tax=Magallana gigas TaxID=29159 RepID=K1QXJ3_MAGGI
MEMCDFEPYPADGRIYCNATFDGVQCWNYSVAGSLTIGACPQNHPSSILFDNPAGILEKLSVKVLKRSPSSSVVIVVDMTQATRVQASSAANFFSLLFA